MGNIVWTVSGIARERQTERERYLIKNERILKAFVTFFSLALALFLHLMNNTSIEVLGSQKHNTLFYIQNIYFHQYLVYCRIHLKFFLNFRFIFAAFTFINSIYSSHLLCACVDYAQSFISFFHAPLIFCPFENNKRWKWAKNESVARTSKKKRKMKIEKDENQFKRPIEYTARSKYFDANPLNSAIRCQ